MDSCENPIDMQLVVFYIEEIVFYHIPHVSIHVVVFEEAVVFVCNALTQRVPWTSNRVIDFLMQNHFGNVLRRIALDEPFRFIERFIAVHRLDAVQ